MLWLGRRSHAGLGSLGRVLVRCAALMRLREHVRTLLASDGLDEGEG